MTTRPKRARRRRTALLVSGGLHLGLLGLFAGSRLELSTEPPPATARVVERVVVVDGPVVGPSGPVAESERRVAAGAKGEQRRVEATPADTLPPSVKRSRRVHAPQVDSPVAIPTGRDVAPVELAPATPAVLAGGSMANGDGPQPMGSAVGHGPPQGLFWGPGGWETDYGRQLADRIEREAEDAELGPRPARLTKSLVVVVEVDPSGRLIRQRDGSLIRVLRSRVHEEAERSLLAAVERASRDFPPFPVQGAKDRFTLEVRFRVGPDGLSL